jgi:hypothetical protein
MKTSQRRTQRRRPAGPRLEHLEDRTLLSVTVIEDFEGGSLAAYQTALRYQSSAELLQSAAHDGLYGLDKQDGYEWMIRKDARTQRGETISVWTQLAGAADGRAYFGFGARHNGYLHNPLSQGGMLSVVLAPNTHQLILQKDQGFNPVDVAAVAQDYQPDQWYRLEVVWGTDNSITGNLYDSDGVTLLNSVTATVTPQFTSGGIAFRALGSDKYFDTVVVDTDSTATAQQIVDAGGGLDPNWTGDVPPPPPSNGPSGGPAPVPWQYTSVPGSGRDVELASFNQLSQVFGGGIVGGIVGLAAQNVSAVHGSQQIGWGPPGVSGGTVPVETPLLAQYLFRQLPGEDTQLIGASSVKHFFDSSHSDFQHLNPGENDTYGSGLNSTQSLYTYGSELDPVTGELHDPVSLGHRNNDGFTVEDNRHFDNRIQYLLQVSVADLDPAQNLAGTRWFLAGNLWVAGDQDVTNNSRWVEVAPSFSGTTFTFTYPNGSGGQANFRTIPGLVAPTGPAVADSDPSGLTAAPVDRVRITFDSPINASTFALPRVVGFTRTDSSGTTDVSADLVGVSPVGGSGRPFEVSFQQETAAGANSLTSAAQRPAPREAVPATEALDGLFTRLGEEATEV